LRIARPQFVDFPLAGFPLQSTRKQNSLLCDTTDLGPLLTGAKKTPSLFTLCSPAKPGIDKVVSPWPFFPNDNLSPKTFSLLNDFLLHPFCLDDIESRPDVGLSRVRSSFRFWLLCIDAVLNLLKALHFLNSRLFCHLCPLGSTSLGWSSATPCPPPRQSCISIPIYYRSFSRPPPTPPGFHP